MASWAVTGNCSETSKALDVPYSTVERIVCNNRDRPEYVKLCGDVKESFVEKSTEVIELALERLRMELENVESHIPVNQISSIISTLYDKRALAKGEVTGNSRIEVDINVVE